jgi:hypothetical protein
MLPIPKTCSAAPSSWKCRKGAWSVVLCSARCETLTDIVNDQLWYAMIHLHGAAYRADASAEWFQSPASLNSSQVQNNAEIADHRNHSANLVSLFSLSDSPLTPKATPCESKAEETTFKEA